MDRARSGTVPPVPSFEVANARARVDAEAGGRLASFTVHGHELLLGRDSDPVPDPVPDPVRWGCYPMAPFAGRVRRGRFTFAGAEHTLPLRMPPHAIHGTVLDRPWEDEGGGRLSIDLGPDWPFPGRAVQQFALEPGELRLRLEVHAESEPFPASLGWHPWFRRRLGAGGDARLGFEAREMYVRDAEGIPDGERRAPGSGPFDDCFTGIVEEPWIEWPGAVRLELHSDLDHWVVYDEPEHALCLEPQSGPPDALNLAPRVVEPGRPLCGEFALRFRAA